MKNPGHTIANPTPDEAAANVAGTTNMREIVMGAQDNLTNVLAVVLGVAIGAGEVRTVALAGLAAGIAEAISMGGVLYTSTLAERDLALEMSTEAAEEITPVLAVFLRDPRKAAVITAAAALVAALVPLAPFALLSLTPAMVVSAVVSLGALFGLGSWTGAVTRQTWWRAGTRFTAIGGLAALGAALVGTLLRV